MENLKACFRSRDQFYCGFFEDKDVAGYVRTWHKRAQRVWTVPLSCLRGLSAEEAVQRAYMEEFTRGKFVTRCLAASAWAQEEANRMVVVCGSLYLMEVVWRRDSHADLFKLHRL